LGTRACTGGRKLLEEGFFGGRLKRGQSQRIAKAQAGIEYKKEAWGSREGLESEGGGPGGLHKGEWGQNGANEGVLKSPI